MPLQEIPHGLALGARCPQIAHVISPFMNLVTRKATNAPGGVPRVVIGGRSPDREWTEVIHMECPECGLKLASQAAGRDILDIVEANILSQGTWPLAAELIDDVPAQEQNRIGEQRMLQFFGANAKTRKSQCECCGHTQFKFYEAEIVTDYIELGTTMVARRDSYHHLRDPLTNNYRFCLRCLYVQAPIIYPALVTHSKFDEFLRRYASHIEAKTPADLLKLRKP